MTVSVARARLIGTLIWATCSVLATPIVGDEPGLEIKSVLTYGASSARPTQLIAGDIAYVAMSIRGLEPSKESELRYDPQITLLDASRKVLFSVPAREYTTGHLGGSIRHFICIRIPKDLVAGEYMLRTAVKDRISGKTGESEIELAIDDSSTFGALDLKVTRDEQGRQLSGSVFSVWDKAFISLWIGGFNANEGMCNIKASLQVKDSRGVVLNEPFVTIAKRRADEAEPISLFFEIPLRREGKFALDLILEDRVSSKSISYSIPVIVIDPLSIEALVDKQAAAK